MADARKHRRDPPQNFFRRGDADIVFGEVDAGFEQGDQFEKLLLERRDAARNRAARLLRGDARLIQRGGVDQVADRLGLRQIDAAIQIGPQREFARLGEARARFERPFDGVAQNHGRAVAGNLDHVFGGVGAGRRKICDHNLINGMAARVNNSAICACHGCQFGPAVNRSMRAAIRMASVPERRTTPSPPRPGGVEMATMVS